MMNSKRRHGANALSVILAVMILLSSVTVLTMLPASAVSNTPLKPHLTIGYWLGGNGGSQKTLAQANTGWDVVNVSFIETRGNYYTPNLNMDLSNVYSGSEAQQTAAFKADIKTLQAAGKKVVISCGGQNGVVHFDNDAQRDTFLSGVKAIVDEYGFDGFDVDFEGSSIACMSSDRIGTLNTAQARNLNYILHNLKSTYGSNFIISAAPEYIYVQGGAIATGMSGAFLPVLDACRDILTYIHPQYYNGFDGDFTWLEESAQAGAPFKSVYSTEGYVRLSEMLITGFVTKDKGTFVGLRPDQVAFGVPARTGAGGGAKPVADYATALNTLLGKYPTYRGVMTWSIGWDETGGNAFVNAISPIIKSANDSAEPLTASISANVSGTVNMGTSITWTASATGGTGALQYSFEVFRDGFSVTSTSYSSARVHTYTPEASGIYTVTITVRDSQQQTAAATSAGITVNSLPLTASITSDKTGIQPSRTMIKFTCTATGGDGGNMYSFFITRGNQICYLSGGMNENNVSYAPKQNGNYTATVYCTDNKGETVSKTMLFTIG